MEMKIKNFNLKDTGVLILILLILLLNITLLVVSKLLYLLTFPASLLAVLYFHIKNNVKSCPNTK